MAYKWQLEKIAANRLKFWQDAKAEVERLEAINQQLLEALEKIEYKGRNANVNNGLAIWMGDTARAVIAMVKGGE